ncbi:MAG: dihydropteroate synthase [Myxococcales bacterium]|nr:dihydropteroate synthase [Myxococcales bacterium]
MGVVNVTPDSFSDGGRFLTPARAIDHALALLAAGADVIDVGGESTRPGSQPTSADEELARVIPVLEGLRARVDAPLSIDTQKAAVAAAALAAGAEIINDVSALADEGMAGLAARTGAGLVLMHMRGTPLTMQQGDLSSPDIVGDVVASLAAAAGRAQAAGVAPEALCLDPGIGFGKTPAQCVALLAGLPRLAALGYPVLVGLSRKSFLGALTGRPVGEREAATVAAHTVAVLQGAHLLRVHDVAAAADAVAVAQAARAAGVGP